MKTNEEIRRELGWDLVPANKINEQPERSIMQHQPHHHLLGDNHGMAQEQVPDPHRYP